MHTARAVHLLTLALTLALTLTTPCGVRAGWADAPSVAYHPMRHGTPGATPGRCTFCPNPNLTLSLTLSRCTFCPCGAVRFSLHGATLRVNGREVMVLHRNLMCQGLQPSVPVAATLCARVCNPLCQWLQPSVPGAATPLV